MPPFCRRRLIIAPLVFPHRAPSSSDSPPIIRLCLDGFPAHISLRAPSLPLSSAGWCFPACSDYYREHVRRFLTCCDDEVRALQSPSHVKGMSGSCSRYKDSR